MLHRMAVTMVTAAALYAPAAVAAETSRALVRSDPRAHYLMLKELYRQAYAAKPMPIDPNGVDLTSCSDVIADPINEALLSYSDAIRPLADVAYNVVRLRTTFTAAGYPERTWRSLLAEFEAQQLQFALAEVRDYGSREESGFENSPAEENADAFYDRIAATLNDYRRSSGAALPRIVNEGGCGAGEVGVHIKTVPANGYVLFIPKFFFQLCQKQGVDPTDVRRCDWWREAEDGMLQGFAGDYLYRARWPDGATREGRISFNDPADDQTFVIRKP